MARVWVHGRIMLNILTEKQQALSRSDKACAVGVYALFWAWCDDVTVVTQNCNYERDAASFQSLSKRCPVPPSRVRSICTPILRKLGIR
jgi:hypothetical protein